MFSAIIIEIVDERMIYHRPTAKYQIATPRQLFYRPVVAQFTGVAGREMRTWRATAWGEFKWRQRYADAADGFTLSAISPRDAIDNQTHAMMIAALSATSL